MENLSKYSLQILFTVLIFSIVGITTYQKEKKGKQLLNSIQAKYPKISGSDSIYAQVVFILVTDDKLIRSVPTIVNVQLSDSNNWTLSGLPEKQFNPDLGEVIAIGDRVIKNPNENWFVIEKTQVFPSLKYKFQIKDY